MTQQKELETINDLLSRTVNVLDKIDLRSAEFCFECNVKNKELLLETYEKLDSILHDSASLLILKIPNEKQHEQKTYSDSRLGIRKNSTPIHSGAKDRKQDHIFNLLHPLLSLRYAQILFMDKKRKIAEGKEPKKELMEYRFSWLEIFSFICCLAGTLLGFYALFLAN